MITYYLPSDDLGKARSLTNFAAKLPTYATLLSIDAATAQQVATDAINFTMAVTETSSFQAFSKTITSFKNFLRDGASDGGTIASVPQQPIVNEYTAPVQGNIFGRLAKLVQSIKAHPNYTVTMGHDLGIIGTDQPPVDPATIKPVLGHNLQAGKPNIIWKKSGHQGVHIYVDRGDGKGFGNMPYTDTKPDFLDEYALPPTGQTALWKYKAIYIDDDVEVGNMSNELSVTVAGIY